MNKQSLRTLFFSKTMSLFTGMLLAGYINASDLSIEHSANDVITRDYFNSRFGQIHVRKVLPEPEEISRAAVMLLHLSPNSGQVFSSFLPLIGSNRIAIAPDYPGYGMSDSIEGEQKIEDYAAAMLDVISAAKLQTPVDLIGYHTGTAVALEMAHQNPKAIGKIALIAVPILTDEERAAGAALPRIEFDSNGEFAKKEFQNSWKWKGPGQTKDSVLASFAEKMRPGARERGASAILAYDMLPVLTGTENPLMIVRVKDDLWEATKRAKNIRPDAKYAELPNYGHGLFHTAPEMMDTIIRDFLDQSP